MIYLKSVVLNHCKASATAAFSIRAIIAGVANTGREPEPMEAAVLLSFTTVLDVCDFTIKLLTEELFYNGTYEAAVCLRGKALGGCSHYFSHIGHGGGPYLGNYLFDERFYFCFTEGFR